MPYEWITRPKAPPDGPLATTAPATADAPPLAELHLWPYRSLPRSGFVWFIGVTAALIALPLFSVLGSPVLWGLLPFLVLAVGGTWYAISLSYRDGEILEELRIWPDRIHLSRHSRRRPVQEWSANPYWVSVRIHPTGGPVPNYLTLKGGEREVELGAFLTQGERLALHHEVETALRDLR